MADLRRCIGSARFGIDPHEAPVADFPAQPSQKDGLGGMCKAHWNAYTSRLARDAKVRKSAADAATGGAATPAPESAPKRTRRTATLTSAGAGQGEAG
ncbi:MAG TPA: hypothetical protein VGQ02_10325 [Candidatus Limnocylindrales bacterium]|jgi:hypothetical protein|nr:hypothetical protein [Candidatus Limnocylindrales bacterium]